MRRTQVETEVVAGLETFLHLLQFNNADTAITLQQ